MLLSHFPVILLFNCCLITVNMIRIIFWKFWQCNSIWGVVPSPPKISETTGPMTMKLLPDVKLNEEARNQKKIDITWLVCKLQSEIPNNPIFRDATSRHANFTKFYRIVTTDVRNKPWKVHIDISKIGYFTEHSVKWRQMLVCKIQNGL